MSYFRGVLAFVSVLAVSACSTVPSAIEQPKDFVSEAEFSHVAQKPDGYEAKEVRWGGIIARVVNLEKDTLIEIVNLPLDSQARPVASKSTSGRFIARVPTFLDPIIYEEGSEITVVGQISKPMPGKVGEYEINFPVVDTSNHYLWEEREQVSHLHSYHLGFMSSWDPYWFGYNRYYWPYRYRYQHRYYPRYRYKSKKDKKRPRRIEGSSSDNRRSSIKRQPKVRSAPKSRGQSRDRNRKKQ